MTRDPSPAFRRFLASLDDIDSPTGVDNLDLAALQQLDDEELARAEVVLLDRLAEGWDDPRVVRALEFLRSDRALKALPKVLERPPDATRVAAALALWRMERHPAAANAIVDTLHRGPTWSERLKAANALAHFESGETDDDARIDDALIGALDDSDNVVRQAAWDALVERHNVAHLADEWGSRLKTLDLRRRSRFASVRRQAEQSLRDLFARLRAGEGPEAVGLTPLASPPSEAYNRFVDSVQQVLRAFDRGEDAEYDIDALTGLEGLDRERAEDVLIVHLEDAIPQAARALALIGCRRAIPALKEARRGHGGPFDEAVNAALSQLTTTH